MNSEMLKELEGNGASIIYGIIPIFVWGSEENNGNPQIRVHDKPEEFLFPKKYSASWN
jgi:hypothetical protein